MKIIKIRPEEEGKAVSEWSINTSITFKKLLNGTSHVAWLSYHYMKLHERFAG